MANFTPIPKQQLEARYDEVASKFNRSSLVPAVILLGGMAFHFGLVNTGVVPMDAFGGASGYGTLLAVVLIPASIWFLVSFVLSLGRVNKELPKCPACDKLLDAMKRTHLVNKHTCPFCDATIVTE